MAEEEESPRNDPRLPVRMRVKISTIDPETDPWTGKTFFLSSDETCANVSRGGAFVLTNETIQPGRRLLIDLEIPGGERVQTLGRVAWTRATLQSKTPAGKAEESGFGVEFLGGPRDQIVRLERFLARSARRRSRAAETLGAGSSANRS